MGIQNPRRPITLELCSPQQLVICDPLPAAVSGNIGRWCAHKKPPSVSLVHLFNVKKPQEPPTVNHRLNVHLSPPSLIPTDGYLQLSFWLHVR